MPPVEIVPTFAVTLLAGLIFVLVQTRFSPSEARLIGLSLVAHLASALVQLWLVFSVYGRGDLMMYHQYGTDLSDAMRSDPWGVAPEVLWVMLQQPHKLSVFVPADGSPTATMVALTACANFVLSDSLLAVSLAFSIASFLGKLVLYQAFRETTPARMHLPILVGVLLVPSAVFWSAGIIKEAVAMSGIGLFVLGLHRTLQGHRSAPALAVAGSLIVGLVKPYILLVLLGAAGVYVYTHRAARAGRLEFRPVALVIGSIVALAGVLAVGELFPRFSIERLGSETARMQAAAFNPKGGSTYVIGDPSQRSVLGQLAYAPLALFTGLYRPLIIESRNAMMVVNGLETTALLAFTAYAGWRRTPQQMWRTAVRYPILTLCLSFVIVFGVAVGLTSANLGTLSRYRMPLVPFLATILVVLSAPERQRSASANPSAAREAA